jgi:hypothetical protein
MKRGAVLIIREHDARSSAQMRDLDLLHIFYDKVFAPELAWGESVPGHYMSLSRLLRDMSQFKLIRVVYNRNEKINPFRAYTAVFKK